MRDRITTAAGAFGYLRARIFGEPLIDLRAKSAVYQGLILNVRPKNLEEMWIICLDLVSTNSEKGRGSEWTVRVG